MVTVEEAREIFGDKIAHLSDDEVVEMNSKTMSVVEGWLDIFFKYKESLTSHDEKS